METPHSDHTQTVSTSRTASVGSGPGQIDYVDLPVRELNDGADLREYTTETRNGEIIKPMKSNATGRMEDWKLVTFTIDDPENPKNWSKAYKWYCTMVVAFTCFVVAFASSVITADLEGPMESFGVAREVSLVVVTVFVVGFGVGKSQVFQNIDFSSMLTLHEAPWLLLQCLKCLEEDRYMLSRFFWLSSSLFPVPYQKTSEL